MKTLDGKVVVITGAGSGIGRALAQHAAQRGAHLALSDIDVEGLAATAESVDGEARSVRTDLIDVADRSAMAAYAVAVAQQFGRVDALLNNAGVSHTGPVMETEYADFEWIMNINFWGVVHGTKEFLPALVASGDGHLVNISSLFGLVAMPSQATYNASKFAVRGFTEAVRQDVVTARLPVHVTCVHPGGIKTGIVRHGRVTASENPDELASFFDQSLAHMDPAKAAAVIFAGMLRGKARVLVGADAHLAHWAGKLIGGRYEDLFAKVAARTRS